MSDVVTACTGSGSWLALVSMLYVAPKAIGPRESSTHAQRRVYVRHDQLRIPKATFGNFEYIWVDDYHKLRKSRKHVPRWYSTIPELLQRHVSLLKIVDL